MNTQLTVAFLLSAFVSQNTPNSGRRVFLHENEVYIAGSGSEEARRLTSDGVPKGTPSISRDGSRVAFVRESGNAMADIIVLDADGRQLHEILFRQTETMGMRFVEGLEWVSNKELAVHGSINPSTVEYSMVDIDSGREVRWYLVDGYQFVPSPDGLHAAYIGYVPHWTPEDGRRPQVCLDHECDDDGTSRGYPDRSRHLEFTRIPEWAPDSTAIAITAEDYTTKANLVIVRNVGSKTVQFAPPGGEDGLQMSWDRNALIVRTSSGAWRFEKGASTFVRAK
jgi:dipeptidyl aminopeptidase/acylaminoacyl peptidase